MDSESRESFLGTHFSQYHLDRQNALAGDGLRANARGPCPRDNIAGEYPEEGEGNCCHWSYQ